MIIDNSKLSRNYKENPLRFGELPPVEDLEYLYLELNLSLQQVNEIIGKNLNCKHLRKFGLKKTQEQKNQCIKNINLKKYGVENISQLDEIKAKKKATTLKNHGVENISQSEKIKQKKLDKYIKNKEEIIKKQKQTFLRKYGADNFVSTNAFKHAVLEKYGVENPSQSKEIQSKVKQTNLEKYGHECIGSVPDIQRKIKETNLERYGFEHSSSSPQVKAKLKYTIREKYGVENWGFNSEDFKKKAKVSCMKKYGTEYSSQKHLSPETLKILSSKENLSRFIQNQELKTTPHLASLLNFSISGFIKYLHKYDLWDLVDHYTSSYEVELQELFPSMSKTKSVICPYEIDLYSEEHKFGIEFNGSYWHSEKNISDQYYHQKKSLLAESKGIFLYHIFEYEWNNEIQQKKIISQVKNILGLNENKIYARKCELKEVQAKEAKVFLNENHLQNSCTARINLGLYYQNELVSLMTFGKSRFDKKYEYELLRFCNKMNTSVIGGASKLFKYFIREYKPNSILSYSHIDKGTGELYQKLGFSQIRITGPDYVWCKGYQVLSRYQCQKYKLLKQGFEGNSEKEIMENRGFIRIFGCGNKVWAWKLY